MAFEVFKRPPEHLRAPSVALSLQNQIKCQSHCINDLERSKKTFGILIEFPAVIPDYDRRLDFVFFRKRWLGDTTLKMTSRVGNARFRTAQEKETSRYHPKITKKFD